MNGRVNAQRGLAPKNRVVQYAVQLLLFCALNNGAANAGLSGGNANNGVGNANWNIGGWNSENSYYFLYCTAVMENSDRRRKSAVPALRGKLNG